MTANDNERLILQRIREGERELYRLIVSENKDRVFAVLMRRSADRDLAEELTQETFIKAFFHLDQFREDSQLSTWLIRIALNLLATAVRKRKKLEQKRFSEEVDPATPEGRYESRVVFARLRSCLDKIDMRYQLVITLCAIECNSYEHVAKELQVPIGTVRSRLNKARLLLKDCMGETL